MLTGCVAVIGSNSLGLGPIAEVAESLGSTVPVVMTAAAAFGLGTAASALLLAFGPLHTEYGFAIASFVAAGLMLVAALAAAWRQSEASRAAHVSA